MKCALVACFSVAAAVGAVNAHAQEDLREEVERLRGQLEATTAAVEELMAEGGGQQSGGLGDTTIGGYGELHYNNLDSKNELDFHRFVLFFGHRFTDRIRLMSELELEHSLAGDGAPGEVELEQAFIDFTIHPMFNARTGLFLMPVGILNETHEPPTFYGVERNPVEKDIIPSTWWEGGVAGYGELAPGLRYDVAVTSGLNLPVSGSKAFSIRSGRQKVAEAVANDPAYIARLRWLVRPGVELATTAVYQNDMDQGDTPGVDLGSGLLLETHAIANVGRFGLRALYARWNLEGDAPEALGRDEQYGWYVEPSVKLTRTVGVFARYNEWDIEAGNGGDSLREELTAGVNYWPHPNVVFKFDVQRQSGAIDDDGFNLAVGYMF